MHADTELPQPAEKGEQMRTAVMCRPTRCTVPSAVNGRTRCVGAVEALISQSHSEWQLFTF